MTRRPGHRAPGPPLLGPVLPGAVHEVNTAVWLREVSRRAGRQVTLADVPPAEWDAVVPSGVDCVWLMGVWERSAAGRAIALADDRNRREWDEALPGWTELDVLGSPYCVAQYACEPAFGGRVGLAVARAALADRGARLLVDLVPNHLAPDHPLVLERPDAFVRGDGEDLARDPRGFVAVGPPEARHVVARGKDPYFPSWPDVIQLNAFSPAAREFVRATLLDIADQADGVRCDMAMLMLDDVFAATWGERAGRPLPEPYWVDVLGPVRAEHPGFVAVAEAYWGREPDLLVQGFDACYDKVLYDRLVAGDVAGVRAHVAGLGFDNPRTVRFLENHDEPRAAAVLSPREREVAAAVAVVTVPGVALWHQGQLDGRRARLPVFLARRRPEPTDPILQARLERVLASAPTLRDPSADGASRWRALETSGWPDNPSHERLLAWAWAPERPTGTPWTLVVVNYSDETAQGLVALTDLVDAGPWHFADALDESSYDRDGTDLTEHGFFVDLPPWGHHVLRATPVQDPGSS